MRRRGLTMQQFVLQYLQVALGREWPSFFFFFGGKTFTHAQYLNIERFDVWIGVAFLSDNTARPVERAAEKRQPIQTSNFWRISVEFNLIHSRISAALNWIEFDTAEMRRMNRALFINGCQFKILLYAFKLAQLTSFRVKLLLNYQLKNEVC